MRHRSERCRYAERRITPSIRCSSRNEKISSRSSLYPSHVSRLPGFVPFDQGTGDAVFYPGLEPRRSVHTVVPVVARAPGREGTTWRSDLRVASFDDKPLELTLELRLAGTLPAELFTTTLTVEPGAVASVNDAPMSESLLGMSFLDRLSGFEVSGDSLVLRP